jgi:hypothetical protein
MTKTRNAGPWPDGTVRGLLRKRYGDSFVISGAADARHRAARTSPPAARAAPNQDISGLPVIGGRHDHEDLFFHEDLAYLFDSNPSPGKKSSRSSDRTKSGMSPLGCRPHQWPHQQAGAAARQRPDKDHDTRTQDHGGKWDHGRTQDHGGKWDTTRNSRPPAPARPRSRRRTRKPGGSDGQVSERAPGRVADVAVKTNWAAVRPRT